MTETRIPTTAPSGGAQAIGKSTECNLIVVRSVGHHGIGAAARSVAFLLMAALFAVSPPQVSAATPDPVLEWIGVMNTTVLKAGTAPNVTGRVVALVSASVFDAVNGIDVFLDAFRDRAFDLFSAGAGKVDIDVDVGLIGLGHQVNAECPVRKHSQRH